MSWPAGRRLAVAARAALRNFHTDHCVNHAAAVSYFALLSLFPLAILTFYYVTALFGRVDLGDWTPDIVERLREVDPRLISHLRDVPVGEGFFVPLLLTMIVSSSFVFGALERATRQIFPGRQRGYLRTRVMSMLMAGGCVALLITLFAVHEAIRNLARVSDSFARVLDSYPVRYVLLGWGLRVATAIAIFVLLYRILPGVRVAWRPAMIAAAGVALGWEALKYGFGLYVGLAWAYGLVYGPLASLVLFLLWIYLVACLFLLGAEFTAVLNGDRPAS